MNKKYKEIIISSGGIKGISLLGALNQLDKYYSINNFKFYTGCSYGAILCFLLIIGYSISDIKSIAYNIELNDYQDLKLFNFINKCGLDEGIKYSNILKAIIINKNIDYNITFKELYDLTNKILTICVTNITSGIPEYNNYLNNPNMSVLLSIRMSSNIPILFSPIKYNDFYYVDGALLDPFPYLYFKDIALDEKIGICLYDDYEFKFINNNNTNFVSDTSNSIDYMVNLIKIIHINYLKLNYKKLYKNVIYIDYNTSKTFFKDNNLTQNEKDLMFNIGVKKTKKFINKKINKYFKILFNKILLKKYFTALRNSNANF
jgi:predicted patatin/cPLA2 family phospholipase